MRALIGSALAGKTETILFLILYSFFSKVGILVRILDFKLLHKFYLKFHENSRMKMNCKNITHCRISMTHLSCFERQKEAVPTKNVK